PDIQLAFGEMTLFANQAIEPLAPIKAGDTLEARTKLQEVYAKTGRSGTMVFMVWETSFMNQHGTTVLRVQDSFVRRNRGKQ
ncbi:MAG: MaoC family dehydratase, partial [Candidatus Tectomicrobia bacterium]|nr:MaoC family dehydratase [Candidatus Tectomicrobia bacterium]